MYNTSEVAKIFGVSNKTVIRWATEGKIRAIRTPGGHYRFEEEHIDRARHPQDKE